MINGYRFLDVVISRRMEVTTCVLKEVESKAMTEACHGKQGGFERSKAQTSLAQICPERRKLTN